MFFKIILISTFYILNNNKINFTIFKFFLLYNFSVFFILNYNNIYNVGDVYIFICFLIIYFYSNKQTIYIIFICFFMKYDNLLINLTAMELINLVFITRCKKNFEYIKKIIINNYLLSTIFIFISLSYFYYNYQTLNKITLSYFNDVYFQIFLLSYLFVKMGGLIGYNLQLRFYQLLSYKDILVYTLTNFYLYVYILKIEQLLYFNETVNIFLFSIIFLNFIILILKKDFLKNKRDFLFFSSQILLNNIFMLILI